MTITESSMVYNERGTLSIKEKIVVTSTDIPFTAAAFGKLTYGDELNAVTIGGVKPQITRLHHLGDLLLTVRKGDTIILHITRDGVQKDVTIAFNRDSYFTKFA